MASNARNVICLFLKSEYFSRKKKHKSEIGINGIMFLYVKFVMNIFFNIILSSTIITLVVKKNRFVYI